MFSGFHSIKDVHYLENLKKKELSMTDNKVNELISFFK